MTKIVSIEKEYCLNGCFIVPFLSLYFHLYTIISSVDYKFWRWLFLFQMLSVIRDKAQDQLHEEPKKKHGKKLRAKMRIENKSIWLQIVIVVVRKCGVLISIIIPKVPFCTWNREQKMFASWLCRWIQVVIEWILLFRLHDVLNRNVCRKGNALRSIISLENKLLFRFSTFHIILY